MTFTILTFQYKELGDVLRRSTEVILLNAKTCMQQTELYPSQVLHQQFIDLYLENNHFLSGMYCLAVDLCNVWISGSGN